jgi:hypothetical protein
MAATAAGEVIPVRLRIKADIVRVSIPGLPIIPEVRYIAERVPVKITETVYSLRAAPHILDGEIGAGVMCFQTIEFGFERAVKTVAPVRRYAEEAFGYVHTVERLASDPSRVVLSGFTSTIMMDPSWGTNTSTYSRHYVVVDAARSTPEMARLGNCIGSDVWGAKARVRPAKFAYTVQMGQPSELSITYATTSKRLAAIDEKAVAAELDLFNPGRDLEGKGWEVDDERPMARVYGLHEAPLGFIM